MFSKCNELIYRENSLKINKYESKGHLSTVNKELEKYEKSLAKEEAIFKSFFEFQKRVFKKTLPFLIGKAKKDWQIFEKKWWLWEAEDIVFWWKRHPEIVRNLFESNKYDDEKCAEIIAKMEENGIKGENLDKLDNESLVTLGINDLNEQRDILKVVKFMCSTHPKDMGANVGIPPEFICPLTNQIMDEPVEALVDGFIYEKTAILKYLQENRESPKTKKKLSKRIKDIAGTLLPADKLKVDIEAFKKARGHNLQSGNAKRTVEKEEAGESVGGEEV